MIGVVSLSVKTLRHRLRLRLRLTHTLAHLLITELFNWQGSLLSFAPHSHQTRLDSTRAEQNYDLNVKPLVQCRTNGAAVDRAPVATLLHQVHQVPVCHCHAQSLRYCVIAFKSLLKERQYHGCISHGPGGGDGSTSW